jgi:GTPase SAR1 family protein
VNLKWYIGAVIVYDITDETSFTKVTMWITELKKYVETDIPIIIAANKSDLKNRVIN